MKIINFILYIDRDNYLPDLLSEHRTVEIDLEVELNTRFVEPKLINVLNLSLNGVELDDIERENLIDDIGWDLIESQAIKSYYSLIDNYDESDLGLDEAV